MKDQSTNFEFLRDEFPILYTLALGAEYNLYSDPNVSLFKLRQFVEKLVDTLYNEHYLDYPHPNTLAVRIKELGYENIITDKVQGHVTGNQVKDTTGQAITSQRTYNWRKE